MARSSRNTAPRRSGFPFDLLDLHFVTSSFVPFSHSQREQSKIGNIIYRYNEYMHMGNTHKQTNQPTNQPTKQTKPTNQTNNSEKININNLYVGNTQVEEEKMIATMAYHYYDELLHLSNILLIISQKIFHHREEPHNWKLLQVTEGVEIMLVNVPKIQYTTTLKVPTEIWKKYIPSGQLT